MTHPTHAIAWFEIPVQDLARAQAFYEAVTGHALRREAMGPSQGAVFAYDYPQGVGGALMCGPTAPAPATGGTLVYLDASPSLDAALARAVAAGARWRCRARPCHRAWASLRTSPTWTATAWACTP
ncbi:VOC family protein [Ideonella paludis]|uniref:VOC family protein n=1 Tax=Ideonella paludis TaxID=1233411 RepID=UPI003632FC6B